MSGCDLAQPEKRQEAPPIVQNDPEPEVPPNPPEQKQNAAPVPAASGENMVTVAAAPGMTGKGNYASANANNAMGIVTVPVATFFNIRERVVLLQIQDGLNKFKGEHGRFPATHAEFMEQIVRANNIKLPVLPPNHEFVFEGGELKVQKPR